MRGTETALRVLHAQLQIRTSQYRDKMEEFLLNGADGKISEVGKTPL